MTKTAESYIAENSQIFDDHPEHVSLIARLMEDYAALRYVEETNLLRSVMTETADRLESDASKAELAQHLRDAASGSFAEILNRNVEIELDVDLPAAKNQGSAMGDPVLMALFRAIQIHDAISALTIAGQEPSDDRKNEFRTALSALRDTLNTHIKDKT